METADSLKKKLGCHTDEELGAIFKRSSKAVSAWRTRGLPAAIERWAHEIMKERGIIPGSAVQELWLSDRERTESLKTAPEKEMERYKREQESTEVEPMTKEMKEINELFKNYPLIKATMLKMSAMTEDEQFEFYKQLRDAEIAKRKGGKTAAHED